MLVSFVYVVACRLFALVLLLGRSDGSKGLEIVLLRQELAILRRVGCANPSVTLPGCIRGSVRQAGRGGGADLTGSTGKA